MSEIIEFSRLISKRSATSGVVPTIPSTETIDETWLATDLKKGEMFINIIDERIWYRANDKIVEVISSGNGVGIQTTDGTVTTMITVPTEDDSCTLVDVEFVCIQEDGAKAMSTNLRGTFKNDGGTVTVVGAVASTKVSEFAAALGQLTISGTDILAEIQGEAATTINWSVKAKTSQVKV